MGRIRAPIVFRVGDAGVLPPDEHGLEVEAVTLQTRDDELEVAHLSMLCPPSRGPIQDA